MFDNYIYSVSKQLYTFSSCSHFLWPSYSNNQHLCNIQGVTKLYANTERIRKGDDSESKSSLALFDQINPLRMLTNAKLPGFKSVPRNFVLGENHLFSQCSGSFSIIDSFHVATMRPRQQITTKCIRFFIVVWRNSMKHRRNFRGIFGCHYFSEYVIFSLMHRCCENDPGNITYLLISSLSSNEGKVVSTMSIGKPTTCKDALRRWEENDGREAVSVKEVNLSFQWPPIEKMDNSLCTLVHCEKLSLSTNMIEKISCLSSLKTLKILSLGRNFIKGFTGLEALGETLEELWISYNCIEKMKGINSMKNLQVLYMSNNQVREWNEFMRLQELSHLRELLFVGNPLYESLEIEAWRAEAARRLPNLEKLDGEPIIHTEDNPMSQQIQTSGRSDTLP